MKHINNKLKKAGSRLLVLGTVLLLSAAGKLQAQNVDLQAVSIDPSQPSLGVGQVGQIVVSMRNNGPAVIPVGEATAQITLSSVYLDIALPVTFSDAPCNQWSYLGNVPGVGTHNLFFQNNAGPIPVGSMGCAFTLNIAGKALTPAPSGITLASSLSPVATTSDVNGTNQAASTEINVSPILPVVLADFNVTASSCNGVLNWKTASELNVKSFEIEYSTNGTQFTTVGSVLAKNSTSGSAYKYVNAQGTVRGYYRLKAIDVDGHVSYSRILSVDTKCNGTKSVSLYPNPLTASQNLSVIVSGYEGSIKGELVSMSGQVMNTYTLKNGTNSLPVDKLAQATYMLRVTDAAGESESFRVVIIK